MPTDAMENITSILYCSNMNSININLYLNLKLKLV